MIKEFKVGQIEKKTNIADYLKSVLGISSRQAKKLLEGKKVSINGRTAYRDNKLVNGDILRVDLSEEQRQDIVPEDIGLSVIYEDDCILAVNKPPYMLVHPTPNHPTGTLLNAAAYYFKSKGEETSLRLLNRLDMNTSGIVVLPKSASVHRVLSESMREGAIKKIYMAITEGVLNPPKGMIEKAIGKDEADPVKRKVTEGGQPAVTVYETVSSSRGFSLVKLELVTGRTHQIRVHLSFLGCPVVGDTLYGKESPLIGRQALHASYMELPHPKGSGMLRLHGEPPDDFRSLAALLDLE